MSTSTTCKYTLTDSNGTSNEATITVEVTPPAPTNIFLNPFNKESAHHKPLASGYTTSGPGNDIYDWWQTNKATIAANFYINWRGQSGVRRIIANESDPVYDIYQRDYAGNPTPHEVWQIGSTLRIPASNDVPVLEPTTRGDNVAVVCQPDGTAIELYRCYKVGTTYFAQIARQYSLTGLGHGTVLGDRVGTSAVGVSLLFGAIDYDELTAGEVNHAHQCSLGGTASRDAISALNRQIRFPACNADGHAGNTGQNLGLIPYGTAFVIPPSLSVEGLGLTTIQAVRLGNCTKKFPIYAVDTSYGMTMRSVSNPAGGDLFRNDMRVLIQHLVHVTNSTSGGTAYIDSGVQYGNVGVAGAAFTGTPLADNTAFDA